MTVTQSSLSAMLPQVSWLQLSPLGLAGMSWGGDFTPQRCCHRERQPLLQMINLRGQRNRIRSPKSPVTSNCHSAHQAA